LGSGVPVSTCCRRARRYCSAASSACRRNSDARGF
jgi:hypothetical protein